MAMKERQPYTAADSLVLFYCQAQQNYTAAHGRITLTMRDPYLAVILYRRIENERGKDWHLSLGGSGWNVTNDSTQLLLCSVLLMQSRIWSPYTAIFYNYIYREIR